MSTKTTFKRIALVAVAAMGFGLLSVVPSSATSQSDTLTVSSATSTTTVGSAVSVTLTQTFLGANSDTMSVTASIESAPTGNLAVPVITVIEGSTSGVSVPTVTNLVGIATDTVTSGYGLATAAYKVTFTPTAGVTGTYVIKFTPSNGNATLAASVANPTGVAARAAAVTWTITYTAQSVGDITTTSIINPALVATGSADAAIYAAAGSSTTAVATIVVTPKTAGEASTGSTVLTAVITGPGTISINNTTGTAGTAGFKNGSYSATGGAVAVHVHGDGSVGTSTITISLGALVVGTETVRFTGAAASVTSTLLVPVINSGSGAVSTGSVISATVKDASGNGVSGVALFAVSGTATSMASATATTGSAGVAYFSFTGLAAGTSAITVQNVAAGSTATFSAAALSVRAGSNIASSVTMTLDKATYSQGEAAVLTVTIKDAAGNLVADGTHAAFSADVTSTRVVTGGLPLATGVVTSGSSDGTKTYKINVPTTSGAFTISGLGGADLAAAQAELAISVTATVSQTAAEVANADAIAAAADAAAEATDAANAATDAANAAAEAADAATAAAQDAADAVATLGTQVAELIDGLKAQIAAQKAAITALTNLVIKIQKKLKA